MKNNLSNWLPFYFHKNKESEPANDSKPIEGKKLNKTQATDETVKIRPELASNAITKFLKMITDSLSNGTETPPALIAMFTLIRLAISIPVGRVSLPFGADYTVPRLNALFVLPTGAGKGLSEKQTNALFDKAISLSKDAEGCEPTLHARVHSGGLSTGEGIAYELRDSSIDAKGNESEGVDDKRLIVVESEFVNILTKCRDTNSILSGTIRKLFDGDDIALLTKTNRTVCTNPHVGIIGHITPRELLEKLDNTSVANGFANRFPIFVGMQQKDQPFPKVIDQDTLTLLAEQLNDVLVWANQNKGEMELSQCFKELWVNKYGDLRRLGPTDTVEQSLLTRAAHYSTMYAMMFAVLDKTNVITASHLESSLAWIDYWQQSIQYIFNTEKEALLAEKKQTLANDVLIKIKELAKGNGNNTITRTPLQQAMGKKCNSKELSDALKLLQEKPVPPITVSLQKHNRQVITLN